MTNVVTVDGTVQKTISDAELQELNNRLAGDLILSGDESYDTARQVWNGMIDRQYSATASDDVSTLAVCGQFPPGAEAFPEEVWGLPFVLFVGMYAGPSEEGRRTMQPLHDFAPPLIDFSGVMPFTEAQRFFDEDYPSGELRYYWKSLNLYDLSDAAIERIVGYVQDQPSPLTTIDTWHIGGAIRRFRPFQENSYPGCPTVWQGIRKVYG